MAVLRTVCMTLGLIACTPQVQDGGGGGGGSNDSGVGGDPRIDAPKFMWVDAAPGMGNNVPCKNPATPPNDGRHNTGLSCFQSCHDHGFTLAGTLYTNDSGNTGFAGATISVTDSANRTVDVVTSLNGNFYTSQPLTYPVLIVASSCPSAVRMTLAVAASGRGCNTCHVGGTSDQMHLP